MLKTFYPIHAPSSSLFNQCCTDFMTLQMIPNYIYINEAKWNHSRCYHRSFPGECAGNLLQNFSAVAVHTCTSWQGMRVHSLTSIHEAGCKVWCERLLWFLWLSEWRMNLLDQLFCAEIYVYMYNMYLNVSTLRNKWKASSRSPENRMTQQLLPAHTLAHLQ